VFALASFTFAMIGIIVNGTSAHTNAWFSPTGMALASLACLALHVFGPMWPRR
jgi:hypothetical protein